MMDAAYVAVLLISFAGFPAGLALGIISPEEKRPYRVYFNWARKILLAMAIVTGAYYLRQNIFGIIILTLLALHLTIGNGEDFLSYIFLGSLYYAMSSTLNGTAVVSSIVLLFGIPAGIYSSSNKIIKNIYPLLYNSGYLAIGLILPFLASYFQ